MTYHFRTVRMWEKDPHLVLASDEYHLWPLTPLMAGTNAELLRESAERIALADLPRMTRVELEGILAVFATLRLQRETIRQVIGGNPMMNDLLKESGFYELVKEMVEEDMAHRLALRAAEQCFPAMSDATRGLISHQQDVNRLEEAIVKMNNFPDEEALVAYLTAK